MTTPRILLDTNIVIAHVNDEDSEHVNASAARELVQLILRLGFIPVVSHGTVTDFGRLEGEQKKRRNERLNSYQILKPAHTSSAVTAVFPSNPGAQDQSDIEVLSTHATGVSEFLVTEDYRMRQRAGRADLKSVYSLQEALTWFTRLLDPGLHNVPDAQNVEPYTVNVEDPLFESLKDGYSGFEKWWRSKVVAQNRMCIILGEPEHLEGIAVLKPEEGNDNSLCLGAPILKVCTFKVQEDLASSRRGEILLRALIDHARHKELQRMYLTTYETNQSLVGWLEKFGFWEAPARTENDELVLVKDLDPPEGHEPTTPLDHAIRFGPGALQIRDVYAVPIRPNFHKLLFPDVEPQPSLLPNEPCGNAIRKAYLCHAGINRLKPGDTLVFIKTGGGGATKPTVVGIVEETLRSDNPVEVAAAVRGRTVFSYKEIEQMCQSSPVLAIRFRFDRPIVNEWSMEEFQAQASVTRTPQSIQQLSEGGAAWVRQKLGV